MKKRLLRPRLELHTTEDIDGSSKISNRGKPYMVVNSGKLNNEINQVMQLPDKSLHYTYGTKNLLPVDIEEIEHWFHEYNENPVNNPGHLWLHCPGQRLRVGLVQCGGMKQPQTVEAKDLYQGELFKKSRAWVERNCDEWGILSAKHSLVLPDEKLAPYDQTLQKMGPQWRFGWAQSTSHRIYTTWGEDTDYVLLAGELYRLPFDRENFRGIPDRVTFEAPMAGLGLGEQLSWLKKQLEEPKKGRRRGKQKTH